MDRHCAWIAAANCGDTADSGYDDSKALIEKWHGAVVRYMPSPRFAPTSTPEQFERAGNSKLEYPLMFMYIHI